MKKDIHPKYYKDVKVTCLTCGNTIVVASTLEELSTEVCSNCHPFYTGVERIVDTENLVAKFEKKQQEAAKNSFRSKREKLAARKEKFSKTPKKQEQSLTLKDMLASISK